MSLQTIHEHIQLHHVIFSIFVLENIIIIIISNCLVTVERIFMLSLSPAVTVAVVVAFFICWAPFHMQRLIAIYGNTNHQSRDANSWIQLLYVIFTYVSGVLYYFSTTINPILYNIMSNKFREAFMVSTAAG